jgi:hypothetical protein
VDIKMFDKLINSQIKIENQVSYNFENSSEIDSSPSKSHSKLFVLGKIIFIPINKIVNCAKYFLFLCHKIHLFVASIFCKINLSINECLHKAITIIGNLNQAALENSNNFSQRRPLRIEIQKAQIIALETRFKDLYFSSSDLEQQSLQNSQIVILLRKKLENVGTGVHVNCENLLGIDDSHKNETTTQNPRLAISKKGWKDIAIFFLCYIPLFETIFFRDERHRQYTRFKTVKAGLTELESRLNHFQEKTAQVEKAADILISDVKAAQKLIDQQENELDPKRG